MSRLRIRYRLLAWLSRLGQRAARRFTVPGSVGLGVLLVSAAVGLDTNQTVAYQIFSLVAALLAVAAGVALWRERRLRGSFRVARMLPALATAGVPLRYRVRVENASPRHYRGLQLIEDLPLPPPTPADFARALRALPGSAWADHLWPRRVWSRLAERLRVASLEPIALPDLAAMGPVEVNVEVTPARRGLLAFRGALVAEVEPLGLVRALARAPPAGRAASAHGHDTIAVLPRRYPMPRLEVPGTRTYQPGGITLATSVGDSEEFTSLREYRPGDPLQRIHWKSFARVGLPIVMEFQEEFFERHALVLDTFSRGGEDPKFEEAVSVAASFVCALDTHESLLDLLFVGQQTHRLTAGRGQLQTQQLLEALAGARARPSAEFAALPQALEPRLASLSSVILVLLELDAPRRALLGALRARGLPVLALLIEEPREDDRAHDVDPGVHRLVVGDIEAGLAGVPGRAGAHGL